MNYQDLAPWATSPDGTGHSLQRLTSSLYGNDPVNWTGAAPTAGLPTSGGSTNSPPVLSSIGSQSGDEGVLLTFTATATDPESASQTLTYSLDPGAPAGASIHPTTGIFSWIPSKDQGPGVFSVTIRVTDNGAPAKNDSETVVITVTEVNVAPRVSDHRTPGRR